MCNRAALQTQFAELYLPLRFTQCWVANMSDMNSEDGQRQPLSWIVPVIECDDLEMQTLSALGGVMVIFESLRDKDAPQDQATVRRIVAWFADKYGGIRLY